MNGPGDYEVGKGKPPREHQFKKGEPSKNPRGRAKAGPINLAAFFDEPVTATIEGKATRITTFEAGLMNMVQKAIFKKDMRAAEVFLDSCIEAGLIVDPRDAEGPVGYIVNQCVWTLEEWRDHYQRLGPPPWPGPRNGLSNKNWREEVLRCV